MEQVEGKAVNFSDNENQFEQYLTFILSGKVYGLAILNIKEIIEYGDITEVPMTPDFISGVISLRGSVLPVIDLGRRFSGFSAEITKRTSIIVVEIKNDDLRIEVGITVDIVNEVIDLYRRDIEPAPMIGNQIETGFISGMAKLNEKFIILLDIENILSIDDISLVGSLQGGE
jgi:purine-binding chemotaxis protein CheW